MSEPVKQKRGLLAMFTGKDLKHFLLSMLVGTLVGWAGGIAFESDKRHEFVAARFEAYATVAQFAPWNIAQRYVAIVFTQGNSYAETLAHQQEQQTLLFRGFACSLSGSIASSGSNSAGADNPCTAPAHPQGIHAFYLSAHVPLPFRFITALFDILLHALVDQGLVGFLVALTQIVLGAFMTAWAIKSSWLKLNSFYAYVLGFPLAVLALGSLAAIPLWLVALVGLMALKASPLGALGAQLSATGWCVRFVFQKTVEEFGHAAIMKQLKRLAGD
ncbi:MAG: hypothetical protein ABJB01_04545 [Rudaea sp.]